LWAFGSAAIQLARPLFAASFGVPIFLVTLITSTNAVSRVVSAPIIGVLTDRYGRRPIMIAGCALRGLSALAEFWAGSYLAFLILEFIGGIGVSMWITGSTILMADVTTTADRGRTMAMRSLSSRVGNITGPMVGAFLAAFFELRSIFLFNAATKIVMIAILVYLVGESRPDAVVTAARRGRAAIGDLLLLFRNRAFALIALASFALSMMGQGVFSNMFPIYLVNTISLTAAEIGLMFSVSAVSAFILTYPSGWLADRFGRKKTLVPGLLVMGIAAFVLTQVNGLFSVLVLSGFYGAGEALAQGASQAYVADIAPAERRGTFLGVWSLFSNTEGTISPLLIGGVADVIGFPPTFTIVAVFLALSAVMMAALAPDFGGRSKPNAAAQVGA
jgi:MFS family permease